MGKATAVAAVPSAAELQFRGALDGYNAKIETVLNHDAMSLARGKVPVREGDQLTADQLEGLQSATSDFLKQIPVGALAPDVAANLQAAAKAKGLDVRDISATKLGDLGDIGQDVLKGLLDKLKKGSPAAYYSLAATAAAGIGVAAWTGGTDKLQKLGIKPEIKKGFFDDQLKVKLGTEFGAHFKDLKGIGTVEGNVKLGDAGRLTASVTANTQTGLDAASIGYTLEKKDFSLSATGNFDAHGYQSATIGAVLHTEDLNITGRANFDREGLANASVNGTWKPNPNLTLSGGVAHDFRTDRTTANAEAAWKMNNNTDFALSASHDSAGDSRVGVGVRIHF